METYCKRLLYLSTKYYIWARCFLSSFILIRGYHDSLWTWNTWSACPSLLKGGGVWRICVILPGMLGCMAITVLQEGLPVTHWDYEFMIRFLFRSYTWYINVTKLYIFLIATRMSYYLPSTFCFISVNHVTFWCFLRRFKWCSLSDRYLFHESWCCKRLESTSIV